VGRRKREHASDFGILTYEFDLLVKKCYKLVLKRPENIIFGITIVFRMKSIFLYINIIE
jgi:hypothetical protein